jgi:ribokinase
MPRIAVVGSLNMDLVVRAPHLPAPGETILARSFSTAPGGKGANQAVAAAKLGAQVVMVGRVGADGFGQTLIENLRTIGVDTTCVSVDPGAPTGIALIEVDDGGQNTIVVASGANALVSRADVEAAHEEITSAMALIVQLEIPLEVVSYALELAHQANILTVLNPAPARTLPNALYDLTDIVAPNETEASILTGIKVTDWANAEAAARLLGQRGARCVVITLGDRGALALSHGTVRRVLPFAVQAVDTTAAGDAFVAALAAGRAVGRSLDAALRFASAAGALATTKLGAQPSMPTQAELDHFIKNSSRSPVESRQN